MTYSGHLGDWYIGLGKQTLGSKKHFSSFIFYHFNKKYVEVAVNGFAKHLIVWIGLEYKNADRSEKQWKRLEKKELSTKVFWFM